VPQTTPPGDPTFVFDAHVDSLQLALELGVDLGRRSPGQLDLPRARSGGLRAVVFAAWVDPRHLREEGARGRGGARDRADRLFDCLDTLPADGPPGSRKKEIRKIEDRGDWERSRSEGSLAAVAGMEGAHPLETRSGAGDWLAGLEHFFDRGLRVLTLVWNNHLPWIRSCQEEPEGRAPTGLTELGRHIVARLDELGVVVDLSHAGRQSFEDVLEVGSRPPIASHSGCRALHDHARNLDDAQLRALAERGGVVGLPFLPSFLDADAQRRAAELRATADYRRLRGESAAELELARTDFMASRLESLPVDRLVDHLLHAVEVAGIEHVGLGSDFDGITTTVAGLEDASGYPLLAAALRRRGLDEAAVEKVMGGNFARVLEEALPASRSLANR